MKKIVALSLLTCSLAVNAETKIIAHRGDNQFAPQNSVEAAKIAWKNGVKMVEGDFYDSPAGMVCIHGKWELKDAVGREIDPETLSPEDLKNIDLGNMKKWRGKLDKHVRIPLMKDIFATVPADGTIVFEIKGYSADYAKKVDDARKAAKLRKDQILIIAFNADDIKDFNKKCAGYKSLWLYSAKIKDGRISPSSSEAIAKCKEIGAAGVNVGNTEILGTDYVGQIKAAGLDFAVWTVNDYKELYCSPLRKEFNFESIYSRKGTQ